MTLFIRTVLLFTMAMIIAACAAAPQATDEPVIGQDCVIMKWDFKNMKTPPPNLKGPQEPILCTMPGTFKMTKPPVLFRHTTHETMACNACHPAQKNKLITDIDFIKRCPHTLCMGCHQQMIDENLASGPVNCEGCHVPR